MNVSASAEVLQSVEGEESTVTITEAGGRPHTATSRARISAANKGKEPWNKGGRHSEETRLKIAEGARNAARKRREATALSLVRGGAWRCNWPTDRLADLLLPVVAAAAATAAAAVMSILTKYAVGAQHVIRGDMYDMMRICTRYKYSDSSIMCTKSINSQPGMYMYEYTTSCYLRVVKGNELDRRDVNFLLTLWDSRLGCNICLLYTSPSPRD